jgi:hypothetical protein
MKKDSREDEPREHHYDKDYFHHSVQFPQTTLTPLESVIFLNIPLLNSTRPALLIVIISSEGNIIGLENMQLEQVSDSDIKSIAIVSRESLIFLPFP